MFDEAAKGLGRIDAVIDIIGLARYSPLLDVTDEDWNFQHDITLRQAFYAMQYGGKAMKEHGGAMVFVSSMSAFASAPHHAAYGAAKAGLNALVKSGAVELARYKIRVNAVAPGIIATPRIGGSMTDESRARTESTIPLRRLGQPGEIASALLFMISDLSSYVTGQTLTVDGGITSNFPAAMRPPGR